MSPCVAPWLRLQSNWQRILCAGQGSAGHASRDHATQCGFGRSADQCHGSVTWLHRDVWECVWVCGFPYASMTFHDISHGSPKNCFYWNVECRMLEILPILFPAGPAGPAGPRVVQNKSYVMTGGEHPICRVLPFFGQQRSLCDLGRISGKRWGFHKEPGRDPNQL